MAEPHSDLSLSLSLFSFSFSLSFLFLSFSLSLSIFYEKEKKNMCSISTTSLGEAYISSKKIDDIVLHLLVLVLPLTLNKIQNLSQLSS